MCISFARGSGKWLFLALCGEFFAIFLFKTFEGFILSKVLLAFVTAFVFLLFLFFRDPEREIGSGVVAPADGVIKEVKQIYDKDIGKEAMRITTFMNLHNVHVNRSPLDGRVLFSVAERGLHLPAFKKEAEKNEKRVTLFETEIGHVKVVQIVGSVARRIVSYVEKGQKVKKGERIGIILFGSRVDLYLPAEKVKVVVKKGERVKAGESTLAHIV